MKKKYLRITVTVFIFILFAGIIIDLVSIYSYGNKDEKQKCEVAIILGAQTNNNGVSPVYAERLNHGIWLYENGYVDSIIVTGGKGQGMNFSDAYQAKEYLKEKGVPEDIIFLEEKSKITQENLEYSNEIMKDNEWSSCIIVSDPLHMKRAMLMAKDYNMNCFSSPTRTSRYKTLKTKLPFILREEFFYVGYRLINY